MPTAVPETLTVVIRHALAHREVCVRHRNPDISRRGEPSTRDHDCGSVVTLMNVDHPFEARPKRTEDRLDCINGVLKYRAFPGR